MNNTIDTTTKSTFKKFDTPIQLDDDVTTQYGVETKVFTKDVVGKEFQVKETVVIPINKDTILEDIDKQIIELQAKKKEIIDLDK